MAGKSREQINMGMTRLQYLCLVFGERCFYCLQEFSLQDLTRDHVVPRCEGGTESLANQVPACAPCNARKGRRLPTADELLRIRETWESRITKKILKKHAPPCYVCNGNVAALPIDVCPECGRLPNGKYLKMREQVPA